MASKLLTLLALFAACGFAHAQTAMNGFFGSGSSGSGFPFPTSIFSGGSGSSGSGSQTSGSGSGLSGGGSGISSMLGMPQEVMSSGLGGLQGFPLNYLPFPIGGSSGTDSSGGGSGFLQSIGTPQQMYNSIFGGRGTEGSGTGSGSGSSSGGRTPQQIYNSIFGGRGTGDSGTGSSSGGQLIQNLVSRQGAFYRQSKQAAYCEQACKRALPASGLSRVLSSARQGAAHGHKERHGGRSSLPQHTRQNNGCPSFCHDLLSAQGSSTGNSVGRPTGEFGTSASASGGSHTGSQGSGGSVDGSTGGSEHSSNGK